VAADLKHERKVALKVLKPELAAVVGAERFLAEIKTTANLQHPHILALFDSGEADSFLFYVMPYVEGETLQDRIDREKQLPVDEAVRIASAVASALQTAHEQGIIHRDIKPANILLSRGEPLIADFGIALAVGAAGGNRLTETGLSVGTPFYMSPEQATGDQAVGGSTDTYALGSVLYEMLVGDPPYPGSTAQAVLGKIIAGKPVSATEQRPSIPANVDAAVRKALEKLPADRFTSAQEFGRALTDPGFRYGELAVAGIAGAAVGPWNRLTKAFAALAAVTTLVLAWLFLRPQLPAPIASFTLTLSENQALSPGQGVNLALSPDGSRIVYRGPSQLWQRPINQLALEQIPGTEAARNPVLSPDGNSVAFTSQGSLKTVSLLGGPPFTVVPSGVPDPGGGIDWGSDGMLYFTNDEGAIQGVAASGGEPEPVTTNDPGTRHAWVDALPDGRGLLFTITRGVPAQSEIAVMGLRDGEVRILLPGAMARYSGSGHIVYTGAEGTLLAAPFDLRQLEVTGPSVGLLEGVDVYPGSASQFALSETGTLIYVSVIGAVTGFSPVWVERDGIAREIDPGWIPQVDFNRFSVALSPDATRLLVTILNSEGGFDVWIKQLDTGPLSRLTFEGSNFRATWSDDESLTFVSDRRRSGCSAGAPWPPGKRSSCASPTSMSGSADRRLGPFRARRGCRSASHRRPRQRRRAAPGIGRTLGRSESRTARVVRARTRFYALPKRSQVSRT
jgi:serine/threonine-protein kinase